MILAGVDLAWQSENNPSAIACGKLNSKILTVNEIEPAIYGVESVLAFLYGVEELSGIAVDAPLIINNQTGQRDCENQIGRVYGARHASCHTSNTTLYPEARSVQLSEALVKNGFDHLGNNKWLIECYPHPAIIEIFGLPERLKYKKGSVAERKSGQQTLAELILDLRKSTILKLVVDECVSQVLNYNYINALRGQKLKSNEDALDAIVCLYIAGLYAIKHDGRTCGDVGAGYVWIPNGMCI